MLFHRLFPLICLFGGLLLFPYGLLSQSPDSLLIRGNQYFSTSTLRSEIQGRSIDSAQLLLQKKYGSVGFWEAAVTRVSDTLHVSEGIRYKVLSFLLTNSNPGDSVGLDSSTMSSMVASVVDQPYSDSLITLFLASVVRFYNERGFGLARIQLGIPEIDREKKGVSFTAQITIGPRIRVSEVRFEGVERTSESFLRSAIALPTGTLFTENVVKGVQERLERLNLFERVEEPSLYQIDSTRFGLLIRLQEKSTNTFDGVLGYQPATELNENGFFTGLVRIVLRNLFGGGESISGRWEKRDRTTSQLELGYGQPFLFGLPLEVGFKFKQVQEEETVALTSWVERTFDVNVGWSVGDYFTVTTGGILTGVIPAPDTVVGPCSSRQLLNSSTVAVTAGGTFDVRSNKINPVSGSLLAASYTFGSKSISDPANCLQGNQAASQGRRTVVADVEAYVSLAGPLVAANIAKFTDIDGDFLEESELIRFGGVNSVRGYRDGQFRASRIAWGRFEARVLLSPVSFASLFFDGGYYARPADARVGIEADDAIIYGYGVGLQVDTPVGIARFSFALGKEDTFENGKVSVGLIGEF
ncbi:MAG: BamA/TamA family outer membrane protein [Ignavibacteriae bacterium]|nr:BamA/TamA family outer membrane protein [Ignavibacteriota bacterium]MCB9216080.1 BamA/TamA family outer membrane protein [Ignavibacteria bacterium]